jgi:hypothetical protein
MKHMYVIYLMVALAIILSLIMVDIIQSRAERKFKYATVRRCENVTLWLAFALLGVAGLVLIFAH